MLKIPKNKNLFYLCTLILFFLIINVVNIYGYIKTEYVSGWDGLGHVAYAYAYHEHVFPHIFGFIPVWFNGVPFSHFYPPLYYVVTSLLAFANNQTTFLVLSKLFNIAMLIAVIISFYFLSVEFLKSKNKSFFSTFFFILLISTYDRLGDLGVSMESVFNYGFLPQSFSFIFLMLFLLFFNKESTIKNRILSTLTLLCVALSNIHVLILTVLYIFTYWFFLLIDKNFTELKHKIIDCALAGCISLFWFLPMLYYYDFSGAKSSNYGGYQFIDLYLIIAMVLSLICLNIAHAEKNKKMVILSLYVIVISVCNYLFISKDGSYSPYW